MNTEHRVLDHSKYNLSGVGSDLDFESIRADIPLSVEESHLAIGVIEAKMVECDREYNKSGGVKWHERGQYRALSDKVWMLAYTLILIQEDKAGEFVRAKIYWRPYDPSEELKQSDTRFSNLNSMEITKDEIKQLADDYRAKSYNLNRGAGWRTISYRPGSDSLGLMFANRKAETQKKSMEKKQARKLYLREVLAKLLVVYTDIEIADELEYYENSV